MGYRIPNIEYTVSNKLCTGCGICQGACPSNAITFKVINGEFRPQIDVASCKNDKGCHRCYDTCPGLGINLTSIAKEKFTFQNSMSEYRIGNYINSYSGFSSDKNLRYHAGSGGAVSGFLVWLLENNYIDGAVVTSFDSDAPLKVKTYIATTRNEILSAKSSKYSPVKFDNIIKTIKNRVGRYVIVGLPCHIHGFRKFEKIDKKFAEKIIGYFGIYCSGSKTFNFTDYLMSSWNIDLDSISYLSYRDEGCLGGMVVKGNQNGNSFHKYVDYQAYSHPLRSIFTPRRCFFCIDHFCELADVSFGDVHVKPFINDKVGVNSIVTRTPYWDNLLLEAKKSGALNINPLELDILLKSQKAVKQKKERVATYMDLDRIFGKKVPIYDQNLSDSQKIRSIVSYFLNMVQIFIGSHKTLWPIIKYIKSKVNIH